METYLILISAFFLDLICGEPPAVLHPVVYIGKLIGFFEKYFFKGNTFFQFLLGTCLSLLVITTFTIPPYFFLQFLKERIYPIYFLISVFLLKTTFAIRALKISAAAVKDSLSKRDYCRARSQLRSLVSRETGDLDERLIISAAVESVGENITDSVVSPWLSFVFFGVPGAMAFRAINTLDAMIGYHGKYEYFGKFASRLDDIVNFIPARIAGFLICFAGFLTGRGFYSPLTTMLREARKTESPNAGFSIGAIAGSLGVELEKPGHYRIGRSKNPLHTNTIQDAAEVLIITSSLALALCIGIILVKERIVD
ncbi:MAG: cobalamin biosynthesis protein [Candidatus Dadabacteria bacterium]